MKKVAAETEKVIREIEHKIISEIHLLTELQIRKVKGDKKRFAIRKTAYADVLGIMREVTGLELGITFGLATPTQEAIEKRIEIENLLATSMEQLIANSKKEAQSTSDALR